MDEIINYVMETPGNTNPNVLRGMLQNNGGGSGGTMYVECTEADEVKTLNKNFKEITGAVAAGMSVILHQHVIETGEGDVEIPIDFYSPLGITSVEDGFYTVGFMNRANYDTFAADSETAPLTNS